MIVDNHLLSFELRPDGDELEIHMDAAGLDVLKFIISRLESGSDHEHLMTQGWGGVELTEEPQGPLNRTLHSVLIKLWGDR